MPHGYTTVCSILIFSALVSNTILRIRSDMQTVLHPHPNTRLNRYHAVWETFGAMMYIFGFLWGWVNFVFWITILCLNMGWDFRPFGGYLLHGIGIKNRFWPRRPGADISTSQTAAGTSTLSKENAASNISHLARAHALVEDTEPSSLFVKFINRFILPPVAIVMILGPTCGPLIARPAMFWVSISTTI